MCLYNYFVLIVLWTVLADMFGWIPLISSQERLLTEKNKRCLLFRPVFQTALKDKKKEKTLKSETSDIFDSFFFFTVCP